MRLTTRMKCALKHSLRAPGPEYVTTYALTPGYGTTKLADDGAYARGQSVRSIWRA